MDEKKLIYCVDDEENIREVYSYALQGTGFDVETFDGYDSLATALEKRLPDLLLLDIMLDGTDGYQILKKLRDNATTATLPVIMVSAKTTEIDKVKGLDLGADDYIAKPFGVLELIARINAKLRTSAKERSIVAYKDIVVDDVKRSVTVCGEEKTLTLKQYELLKLLCKNAEKVVPRDRLLDNVWGANYGETRTLDIHIGDLRKILENSSAEIFTVRGVGYTLK